MPLIPELISATEIDMLPGDRRYPFNQDGFITQPLFLFNILQEASPGAEGKPE